jgi:hypothetical protein
MSLSLLKLISDAMEEKKGSSYNDDLYEKKSIETINIVKNSSENSGYDCK